METKTATILFKEVGKTEIVEYVKYYTYTLRDGSAFSGFLIDFCSGTEDALYYTNQLRVQANQEEAKELLELFYKTNFLVVPREFSFTTSQIEYE